MMIIDKKIKVHQNKCFGCGGSIKISYELTSVGSSSRGWKDVKFYAPIIHCDVCKKSILAPEYDDIEDEAIEMAISGEANIITKAYLKARAILNRKR